MTPLIHSNTSSPDLELVFHGGPHFRSGKSYYDYPRRHRYHRYHRRDRDWDDAAAAGIFGLAAGALLGQALTAPQPQYYAYGGNTTAHIQWCNQRFRSYDVRTDSYLNYDGNRYRCNSPYN